MDGPTRLGAAAAAALQDPANELFLGAGTMWELSIKVALGKLTLSLPFRQWMEKAIADLGLIVLAITLDHVDRQAALSFHHRDPFDRLLAAQSLVEGMPVVSVDGIFDQNFNEDIVDGLSRRERTLEFTHVPDAGLQPPPTQRFWNGRAPKA